MCQALQGILYKETHWGDPKGTLKLAITYINTSFSVVWFFITQINLVTPPLSPSVSFLLSWTLSHCLFFFFPFLKMHHVYFSFSPCPILCFYPAKCYVKTSPFSGGRKKRKDKGDNGVEFHHPSLLADVSVRLFKDDVDGGGGSEGSS